MVNSNELRLGNWLSTSGGFPMYVVAIWSDEANLNFDGNEGDVWESNYKFLDPIPLTVDWLERFGFEQFTKTVGGGDINCCYEDYRNSHMAIIPIKGGEFEIEFAPLFQTIDERNHLRTIKYVHELQNIWFSLTGKELQLKPIAQQ